MNKSRHVAFGAALRPLSFYTSGELVARVASAAGDETFGPYAKRRGLFETAFRGYLEPIEQYWQPYLNGNVVLSTAIANVVAAISAQEAVD